MKLQLLTLYCFLLSLQGFSQSSLLWKIERPALSKASYLFGTIHLIPAAEFRVSPTLDSLLLDSDSLLFEMDLAHPELAQISMQYMQLDSVPSLKDLYKASSYKKLSKALKKMGIQIDFFQKFKPFLLQQQIMSSVLIKDSKGYESYFLQFAKKHQIETGGLDHPALQLSTLNAIPISKQAKDLYSLAMRPRDAEEKLKDLFDIYRSGDMEKIYNFVSSSEEFGALETPFLYDRNLRWAEGIERRLQEDHSLFIAVGAAHLGGEDGLIHLLQKRGYTLSPIPLK